MAVSHHSPVGRTRKELSEIGRFSGAVVHDFFGARTRTLTGSRQGGVGRPVKRDGPTLAKSRSALLTEAIDFALETLNHLERQGRDVARRLRAGAQPESGEGLRELMNSMQSVMRLASLAASFAGIDLDSLCSAEGLNPEAQTTAAMNELVWHQMSEDRFGLAGVLERSFAATLEGWRQVFVALGPAPFDPPGQAA